MKIGEFGDLFTRLVREELDVMVQDCFRGPAQNEVTVITFGDQRFVLTVREETI